MRIANKIWDSGWGAVFLTLYAGGILYLLYPESPVLTMAAIVPTVVVMFVADQYNNKLVLFFAGGELQRSGDKIMSIVGEDHFFEGAPETVQNRVDRLDRRTYQQNITLLAGVVIAVTSPFIGYLQADLFGLLVGFVGSVLALVLLCRRAIRTLNDLAEGFSEPYNAKYETQ